MENSIFIILLLLLFLLIAIHNMYRLNKVRIEWRTRLSFLVTQVLREVEISNKTLSDLENLNIPLENIKSNCKEKFNKDEQ